MENKVQYQKILFIGSGILAYDCAVIAKEIFSDCQVWELRVTDSTVLEKRCEKARIPYECYMKKELHERLLAQQEKCLVVSAANTYLFPEDVLAKPNLTVINWHNALLPAHKGRNAEAWAIYEGDAATGITWHLVNAGVDQGDILAQREIVIESNDTALSLYRKQCKAGAEVFRDILPDILTGNCQTHMQPEGKSTLHYSKDIPGDGLLDINQEPAAISRFLRAMDYGALELLGPMSVEYNGEKYTFSRYKIIMLQEKLQDGICLEGDDLIITRGNVQFKLRNLTLN